MLGQPRASRRPTRRASDDAVEARLLVVHQDAPSLLAIKRGLEVGRRAEVVGARTAGAAIERLREGRSPDAVLLYWSLPDHGALQFIWSLDQLGLPHRPFLLAFADQWPEDDLSRAMQLGVDAFFPYPIDTVRVLRELASLGATGEAPSRSRLVNKAAGRLLRPNERLWSGIDVDPDWRERMVSLADVVTGRVRRGGGDPATQVLRALDAAAATPVEAAVVKALVVISREGPERVDRVAATLRLGASRVRRLYRAALWALQPRGGPPPTDLTATLAAVLRAVEQRDASLEVSPAFRRLRQAASELLLVEGVGGGAPEFDVFTYTLGAALSCDVDALRRMEPHKAVTLAQQIVDAAREATALDHARLLLLAWALNDDGAPMDAGRLKIAAAALGSTQGDDALQVERLLAAASSMDDAALSSLASAPMEAIRRVLATLTGHAATAFNPVELARRIERVVRAVEPGGEIHQLRLAEVLDGVERDSGDNLGAAARHALFDNLGLPPHLRGGEASLLWDALGVVNSEQEARLGGFVHQLMPEERFSASELRDAAQRSGQGEAFAAWAQERLVEPAPPAAGGGGGRARTCLVAMVDALELPPERLNGVDLARLADELRGTPPHSNLTAADVDRLRALAGLLRCSGAAEQDEVIDSFLNHYAGEPEHARVLLELLEGDPALRARLRERIGLPGGAATSGDVDAAMASSNLVAAHIAASELDDADPRTVPALTKVALGLAESGRVETAIALLERALGLQPRRLNLLLHLARFRVQLGDWSAARGHLERLREIAPGFPASEDLWQEVKRHA